MHIILKKKIKKKKKNIYTYVYTYVRTYVYNKKDRAKIRGSIVVVVVSLHTEATDPFFTLYDICIFRVIRVLYSSSCTISFRSFILSTTRSFRVRPLEC